MHHLPRPARPIALAEPSENRGSFRGQLDHKFERLSLTISDRTFNSGIGSNVGLRKVLGLKFRIKDPVELTFAEIMPTAAGE